MSRLFIKDSAIALALILAGLFARAVIDKALAIGADPTLVAHWAQAQSLFDLTVAVATCGVGAGLSVFAARNTIGPMLLTRDGLIWGLAISGVTGVCLIAFVPWINYAVGREVAPGGEIGALAVAGGFLATAPGLFACLWLGQRRRGRILAIVIVGAAPPALGAIGVFGPVDLKLLLWATLVTQGVLMLALCAPLLRDLLARSDNPASATSWRQSPIRQYVLVGVTIGVLSPASIMWARAQLAGSLSWTEVAQLQALWRTNEWVLGIASSTIGLFFLPRMAAATSHAAFHHELARTWRALCLPAALVTAALWIGQGVIVPFLYSDHFLMPATASALFLAGDAMRLTAWAPMHGLFATERTTAVTIGEWLSLPLFAFMLTSVAHPTLEIAGACYALTYAVFLAFNIYCVYRVPARYAATA